MTIKFVGGHIHVYLNKRVYCLYLLLLLFLTFQISSSGSRLSDSVHEVMQGLQSYFDRALPMMLLYKNERRQYEKEIADDVPPSNVYGAEHLLRLFGMLMSYFVLL